MRRSPTIFLKIVLALIGLLVLGLLLWFPQIEGRNKNSDPISLYFNDPFLAYIYLGAIPFFFAIFQSFKWLGYAEQNKAFSPDSVMALRKIKYCALITIGFIVGAALWIRIMSSTGEDDPAGFIAISIVAAFATASIGTFASILEKIFQNAIDIKQKTN